MPLTYYKFKLFKYTIGFYCVKTIQVDGMTSRCVDRKNIIFWDFEDTELDNVVKALEKVAKEYNLNKIHIFQSGKRNSYRAICTEKFKFFKEVIRIVMNTAYTDVAFVKWSLIRFKFTIRISPKEKEEIYYIRTIENPEGYNRENSLAHSLILNRLYKVPMPHYTDNLKKFTHVKYDTANIPKYFTRKMYSKK